MNNPVHKELTFKYIIGPLFTAILRAHAWQDTVGRLYVKPMKCE
jgi:hypothetical protein